MKSISSHGKLIEQLEERIAYLEETNRWHAFALDLLTSVTDIHGSTSKRQTPDSILQMSIRHLKRLERFEAMAFMAVNEEDSSFHLSAFDPETVQEEIQREIDIQVENGTFAWALNQNNAVIVRASKPGYSIILHVVATRARIRGMFVALVPGHYPSMSNTALDLLSIILNNTAHALESVALYHLISQQNETLERLVDKRTKQLAYQAGHDALTGLANRLMFLGHLDQALRQARTSQEKAAVLLLDLDQFKRINDTLGHAIGDQLLQMVSRRLSDMLEDSQRALPSTDICQKSVLARLGGDEFVLLLPGLEQEQDSVKMIRRLIETISRPFDIGDHEIFLSLSIGVAISPNDGSDAETILRNAETAMYHAKRHGRNNYQFYSVDMNSKALERLILENQLRHALDRNEFQLHYQPQIDLGTGQIVGVEALLRWPQPEIGMVSPMQFIPLAEETGLILPIGEWVLQTACRQMAELHKQGFSHLQVAINLSPYQFKERRLKELIDSILTQTGLPPLSLELELTESALMEDMKMAIEVLNGLRSLGVKISIDDFGTGYSSLNYLKTFPLDSLKIDKTFVHDMLIDSQNETIVSTMISLAHSLNLKVVAEGVEEEGHLAKLRKCKCDLIQGFLFSPAVPFEALQDILKDNKALPL